MPRAQVWLQNQPRHCMNICLSDLCLAPSSWALWLLLRCDGRGEVPGITEDLTPFNWRLPPMVGRRWQQILWELWLLFPVQMKSRSNTYCMIFFFLDYPDCPCFLFLRAPLWRPLPSSISQAHTYNAFLKSCLPLATPALKPCTMGVGRLQFALPRTLPVTIMQSTGKQPVAATCWQCWMWHGNPAGAQPGAISRGVQSCSPGISISKAARTQGCTDVAVLTPVQNA